MQVTVVSFMSVTDKVTVAACDSSPARRGDDGTAPAAALSGGGAGAAAFRVEKGLSRPQVSPGQQAVAPSQGWPAAWQVSAATTRPPRSTSVSAPLRTRRTRRGSGVSQAVW